ncbi:MAG TPA: cytochrome o ubiquinol oxidase subunit IV [Candidatus Saccharimonadales bacterium]|nr:cytochrome o ubiquinol oxidase subunit IV [Candidatus Saccharimonadales bacterium]
MKDNDTMLETKRQNHGSIWSYISGFGLSLILTMEAYLLTKHHVASHHLTPSDTAMRAVLPILAVIQLLVQLVFFLHMDKESKPRWNLVALFFAFITVLIIVGGSLWIMYHLNYNMTPQQMNNYLLNQDGGI